MVKKRLPSATKKDTTPGEPARKRAKKAADGDAVGKEAVSSAIQIPPPEPGFPIVGIGASAGGLAAFEAFFSAMPSDTESGMALVLVPHLSPDHKSMLVDLVKRYTRMEVYEVEDGMAVKPNCIYIIPPNRDMAFVNSTLHLLEPIIHRGLRMPIDYFFRSLAQDQHERAICIVLSGTGSDGALGVRAVKGEGGMAMAQLPESTQYDGMPRSAIATGLVDYVLPPAEMPAQLIAYVTHAFGSRAGAVAAPKPKIEDSLRKICFLLRDKTGHDFSQYKQNTLIRRIERRMALHQIKQTEQYVLFLQKNVAEIGDLFRDLLIGVTSFFRDVDAFAALEQQVIPRLFERQASGGVIRVWVCGCSTGEEAYSIGMLLQERMEALGQQYKLQIFATDIDRLAIDQARTGTFPVSIVADVSAERLARFFSQDIEGGVFRIRKVIRDMVAFSEQDVIKDPPFSKVDLISCRNLLIYLNGTLQKKLIPLFHYALNPGGYLFLGTSETVGEFVTFFSTIDRKGKLYQRQEDPMARLRVVLGDFVPPLMEESALRARNEEGAVPVQLNLRELTEQALLRHFSPAAIMINGRGEILHIYGRTGNYLEPAAGDAAMNILSMSREGLRRELTMVLHRAAAHKVPAHSAGVRVKTNGEFTRVNLTVRPLEAASGGSLIADRYLVILEESKDELPSEPKEGEAAGQPGNEMSQRINELEQELRVKEEYLQTTLEEMESSNEELKSTNEEMQSVNEELQSTNEELETSKEELQSVNEELATVNAELQTKVLDLSRANNDMNNLLAGTGVATLFVDHQLCITRFTPAVTQLINLIQSDVGRPVGHLMSNLMDYDHLVEDVQSVLDTLTPKELEVQTKADTWYLMRIRPYRTLENVIEGAVVTFIDITERKRNEAVLNESKARFQATFEQAIVGIAQVDLSGRFLFVNESHCRMLGYSREELLQMHLQDLTHPDDLPRNMELFRALIEGGAEFQIEKRYLRKDGGNVWVNNCFNAIYDAEGKIQSVVAISIDVTKCKQIEEVLLNMSRSIAGESK